MVIQPCGNKVRNKVFHWEDLNPFQIKEKSKKNNIHLDFIEMCL